MAENLTTNIGDRFRLFWLRQGVFRIGSNNGGADIPIPILIDNALNRSIREIGRLIPDNFGGSDDLLEFRPI